MNNKNVKILITILIVGIILTITSYWFLVKNNIQTNTNKADTAKIVTIDGDVLLTIELMGGLCVDGNICYSKITIGKNGSYIYTGRDGRGTKGTIPMDRINKLETLIKQTDFTIIKSKKFTGTCPTAYDGQAVTYTFYPMKETIPSCTYAIDQKSPLFGAINNILTLYVWRHNN